MRPPWQHRDSTRRLSDEGRAEAGRPSRPPAQVARPPPASRPQADSSACASRPPARASACSLGRVVCRTESGREARGGGGLDEGQRQFTCHETSPWPTCLCAIAWFRHHFPEQSQPVHPDSTRRGGHRDPPYSLQLSQTGWFQCRLPAPRPVFPGWNRQESHRPAAPEQSICESNYGLCRFNMVYACLRKVQIQGLGRFTPVYTVPQWFTQVYA